MPSEGAAILSQMEGLAEQFLALPYETPVKDAVGQFLDGVIRPGMQELRMQDEQAPPVGQEGTMPMMGGKMPPGMPPQPTGPPAPQDERMAYAQADQGAMASLQAAQSKSDEEQTEEDKKKKKKPKA